MSKSSRKILPFLLILAGSVTVALPQIRVLSHREQTALQRAWIEKRFNIVLPQLMRREGIDMWLIVSREYNDDPVFRSLVPPTIYSSRRRTILVFYDRGPESRLERLSLGRFDYDGLFPVERTHNDGQWEGLRKIIEQRDPKVIGINTSENFSHADGLTANEKDNLAKALGPKYAARMKSAEKLAVDWLETKLPEETDAYRHAVKVAHQVIAEAFSGKVVVPGITTNQDVAWWMRQRVAEMGLGQWFHPTITIWSKGDAASPSSPEGRVIQRGDMLHCDFGILYLGFATDTQRNAYVLLPDETDAPAGLKAGLKAANRLQDLTMQSARIGGSGNEALAAALSQAKKEGLIPAIYCHPIGYHGHGAGPPVGMTDYQEGVPVRGDYPLLANSWHVIELNVTYRVKEWDGKPVRFALEDDAVLLEKGWDWVDARQTEFYLIR